MTAGILYEESVRPLDRPFKLWWLNSIVASPMISTRVRVRLLRQAGVEVGTDCGVWPHVKFVGSHDVCFGDRVFVNSGVVFDARASIRLGSNVAIGPDAKLLTSTHVVGTPSDRAGVSGFASIQVGTGTWIGAGAIVLAGVTIGAGCIIGAGAVVNQDCAPNGLYVGVPARRHKDLAAE